MMALASDSAISFFIEILLDRERIGCRNAQTDSRALLLPICCRQDECRSVRSTTQRIIEPDVDRRCRLRDASHRNEVDAGLGEEADSLECDAPRSLERNAAADQRHRLTQL